MKSFRKELWFNLPNRRGFVNITPEVEKALADSGIREGFCLVNAMHITASVLSTMTSPVCTTITTNGWKGWLRTSRSGNTGTTAPAKTTPTPTSSAR